MAPLDTSEDIQQILERAMAHQQEFSRQQLEGMAAELEIPSDLLQISEQEWRAAQVASQQEQKVQNHQRRGFKAHLIPFLAVNSCMVVLNLLTCPQNFWAIYPITGWGIGLTAHGWKAYRTKTVSKI
jgi:hypothetical protein